MNFFFVEQQILVEVAWLLCTESSGELLTKSFHYNKTQDACDAVA